MDELKTKIDLVPLSDDTIKHSSYLPADLWMLQVPGEKALGPFYTKSLKDYAHKYQYLFEKAKVYNLESDEWKDMFAVSKFQRRKPQLVSAHNLMDNQEFYIIFQGQKNGPHSPEKIQQLLDEKQITTSTQLSLDKGKSWIKLYEHHAFDRRSKKLAGELPAKPTDNVLTQVIEKKDIIIEHNHITDEMLVELSIMKKRSKKRVSPTKSAKTKKVVKKTDGVALPKIPFRSIFKYAASTGAMALLVVVVFNFSESNNMSKFRAEVPTQIRGINNSERSINKRVPASVAPTRKIKAAKRKNVVPRFRSTKRRPATKKPSIAQDYENTFEQDIENIDINDPDFQEELTRQLANSDDDEEFYDENAEQMPEEDFYPEDMSQSNSEYQEDEGAEFSDENEYGSDDADFNPEERVEHEAD